jgi:hypothetical protein
MVPRPKHENLTRHVVEGASRQRHYDHRDREDLNEPVPATLRGPDHQAAPLDPAAAQQPSLTAPRWKSSVPTCYLIPPLGEPGKFGRELCEGRQLVAVTDRHRVRS